LLKGLDVDPYACDDDLELVEYGMGEITIKVESPHQLLHVDNMGTTCALIKPTRRSLNNWPGIETSGEYKGV
jgi:hypothetical protein